MSKIHKGKFKRTSDRIYKGEIVNDIADGYGEEIINDIFIYKGYYKNNLPNGKGVFIKKEGEIIFNAIFKNGIPVFGSFYKENKIFKGTFSFQNEIQIYEFKSFSQIISILNIKGWVLISHEKTVEKRGEFIKTDDINITGLYTMISDNGNYFEGTLAEGKKKGKG